MADPANSSREISEEEIFFARKRNIDPYDVVFARDALALIVNEANPTDGITLRALGSVYSGALQNWQGVGGNDEQITLYGRQSSSGTYIFFRESP